MPQYVFTYTFYIDSQLDDSSQENQEYDLLGYATQHVAPLPGPAQGAFRPAFVHQVPGLGQPGAENLRRLASRYLHQPNSRVDVVCIEPGPADQFKVVIIVEVPDVL